MPNISFIIPIYNVQTYLEKCLDSLVKQTVKAIEIILIDDGSTDNSFNICQQYLKQDERIKLIYQENKGVSSARNRGLVEATGDYIIFVDPDDWVEVTLAEEMIKLIKTSNADVILFNHFENKGKNQNIYNTVEMEPHLLFENQLDEIKISLLNETTPISLNGKNIKIFGAVWGKCFKRKILIDEAITFEPSLKKSEDMLFNLHVLEYAQKAIYSHIALYHYRINEDSITHRHIKNVELFYEDLYFKTEKYIERFHDKETEYEKAFLNKMFNSYLHILTQDYFHPQNKINYRDKKRSWTKLIKRVPIQRLVMEFSTVDSTCFHKLIIFLTSKTFFRALHFLFLIKKFKNKLVGDK